MDNINNLDESDNLKNEALKYFIGLIFLLL